MPESAVESKRSWRSPPRGGLVLRSRYVWRWILSGLAIGLIGLAVYWAWPQPIAQTMLLVLSDDREERSILPPVPFVAGDAAALQSWAQAAKMPSLVLPLSKVETASWLARQLSPAAANKQLSFRRSPNGSGTTPNKDDTVVIYIKGHGLALDVSTSDKPAGDKADARPVLIKSLNESDLAGPWHRDDAQIIDVRQLLQELAELSNIRMFVIFDAVHLNYDPRLGTLVNAFPEAVKQAVEQLPSRSNLWVLVGQGDGELAVGLPGAARSALVDSLVTGLEQKKGEGVGISVDSLTSRVQARLNELNQGGRGSFSQKVQRHFPLAGKGIAGMLTLPMSPPPPPTDKSKAPIPGSSEATQVVLNAAPVQAVTTPAQQVVTGVKAASASVSASTAPAAQPAAAKDGGTPAAAASGPAGGQTTSAPPAAGSSSPPPATPAPLLGDLELAWESRDRLRAGFRNGWSPTHIAPHLWRRIEGLLAGFDEQRLAGEQDPKDRETLRLLREDLSQLEAIFAGRDGACTTDNCRDLADSFAAFKNSAAFRSFQARQQSGLDAASEALKAFAETAYRARDYVFLHGQTAAVLDGGPFVNDSSLEGLLDKLQALRGRLDPVGLTDARLTETRSRELARLMREVDLARGQVEAEIEGYARGVATAQTSPGKLLRVRLLMHSPATTASLRAALRQPVESKVQNSDASGAPSAPAVGERLAANARLTRKLLASFAPASQASGQKASSAAFVRWAQMLEAATAKADPLAWIELGRASREFSEAWPAAVKSDASSRGASRQEPTSLESWELYRTVFLVDGRDARRWPNRAVLTSWISQPIRPELVPDKVELAVSSAPVQLRSPDQEAAHVSLAVRIQSEQPSPHSVTLDLRWNANDVDVTRADNGTPLRSGRNELIVESDKSELQLRIKSRRMTTESPATLVRAQASFGAAQLATADVRCLLPRPDQIDLTIAADDNLSEAKRRAWAPSTPQGGRLNLFANRERTVALYLTNLSSEDKKLVARLYRVPPAATSAGGRLFDAKAGLALMPSAATFDTRLSQPNADIANLLRGQLIAQTNDKEPFALPAGSSPVKVPLVATPAPPMGTAPPSGAASTQPTEKSDDATGGLLLVVHSADGKGKPYFKWIELQMLQPDDLLAIKEPMYREGKLTFRVELKDAKLIEEMGLAKQPLKLTWDSQPLPSEVREPTKEAEMTASNSQGPVFSATVPATVRWPLYVQLHVDRDPRALVASLDRRGQSLVLTNLKENRPPTVHIWRAGASPQCAGMPPERIQFLFRPKQSWLAFPTAASIAEGLSDHNIGMPIFVRIDPRALTTRLDLSLGADVAPKYFSDGARLRVSAEGQVMEYATERQVGFRTSVIEGGLLQVQCEAGDFTRVEFGPIDVPQDRRIEVAAEVDGNSIGTTASESLHDSVTFILDRTPPQISLLTAEKLPPPAVPVPGALIPTRFLVRCRADDGDGSGITKVDFVLGFDLNRNVRLDEVERRPPIAAAKQPDGFYAAEYAITGDLPSDLLLVEAVATDNVQHVSAPGQFSLPLPKQTQGGQRTTFGGKKIEDPTAKGPDQNPPVKKGP